MNPNQAPIAEAPIVTPNFDTSKLGRAATGATISLDGVEEPEFIDESTPEKTAAEILTEQQKEKITEAKHAANLFLRRHGSSLGLFARDSSLSFHVKEDIPTFQFEAKTYSVGLPLGWFMGDKYTSDEFFFAAHHEEGHFLDMKENPDEFIANFEKMDEKALELAREYCAAHPGANLKRVHRGYYKQIHTLFNCLDDIYVNTLVARRVGYFASRGDGSKSIPTLYEKLGFGEADLTKEALHLQMAHALLRDAMIGDTHGKSIVDERVEKVLSSTSRITGFSIRGLVETELKPKVDGGTVDPARRYDKIWTYIVPKYLKLLETALEERDQKSDKPQKGSDENNEGQGGGDQDSDQNQNSDQNQDGGQDSSDPFDDFNEDANKGSLFDESGDDKNSKNSNADSDVEADKEAVRKLLDEIKERKKIDEMSQEARNTYEAQKRVEEFDAEHNITKEQRAEIENIKKEIDGPRKKMREFWTRLIGKSIEYARTIVKEQLRGKLDVASLIRKYPEIQESIAKGSTNSSSYRPRIFERPGLERQVVDQPEEIEVTLLVDCSGSMEGDKCTAAKRTAALLMYSIMDFNRELDEKRRQTKSKLHADTEVIVFGSDSATIKPFKKDVHSTGKHSVKDMDEVNIIKSVSEINADHGGTDDATPLSGILTNISPENKSRIRKQKLKKIVFEITDGQPKNSRLTADTVKTLAEEGVVMVGFQIGTVGDEARQIFNTIWAEENGGKGIFIGNEISELPTKLIETLSGLLEGIKI